VRTKPFLKQRVVVRDWDQDLVLEQRVPWRIERNNRDEERIGADKERAGTLLGNSRERRVDLAFAIGSQDSQLQRKHTCSRLHVSQLSFGPWKIRIHEYRNFAGKGSEFADQSQLLGAELDEQVVHARHIAARPVQAGDETQSDRIIPGREYNWNR